MWASCPALRRCRQAEVSLVRKPAGVLKGKDSGIEVDGLARCRGDGIKQRPRITDAALGGWGRSRRRNRREKSLYDFEGQFGKQSFKAM